MFSKVLCYYEKNDLKKILSLIEKEKEPLTIICETEESKNYISQSQHNIKLLDEYFPIYSDQTFQAYQNTKTSLLEIQKIFENIKLFNHEINIGLLHYIKTDVLLIEKIKMILEDKKNYIFIFKKIRHVNICIQKIAKLLNYENDNTIQLIKNEELQTIEERTITKFEKSDKLVKYRNSFVTYSTNITRNEKNKLSSFVKLSKKAMPMLYRLSKSAIYERNPAKSKKSILIQVQNKVLKEIPLQTGFFLSSDRKDLLESFYTIFQKFQNEKIPFKIFTVDPLTSSFLDNIDYPLTNFFEETYTLANVLKKTIEAQKLQNEIIKLAKENNLFLIYNEKLNYEIMDGVYRAIAITLTLESCFKKIKLQNIVIIEGTIIGMITAYLGQKFKIPSFSVETLIVDKNSISSMLYKADKICIYGIQGLETLLNFGINQARIEVTGNPKYDYIKNLDTKKSKKILEQNYKISSNSKVILIAMSRWHEKDEVWMSDLIKFANMNNFEIVIKLHPRYKIQLDENQDKIDYIKKECKNKRFLLISDIDLNLLMSSSDVIISDYSNVGVEGVLLGKSVININFTCEDLTNAQNYHKLGAVLYTESYEELENMIKEIILDNKRIKELQNNQKIMIEQYNFQNDGRASERIFKLISSSD